jgi:hypothetical protein
MKRLIMAVIGVGVVVVGLGWHLNRPTTPAVSPPEPATETAPAPSPAAAVAWVQAGHVRFESPLNTWTLPSMSANKS